MSSAFHNLDRSTYSIMNTVASSAPQCRCNPPQWAVLKTVQSAGANQGKTFYSCPNFRNKDDKGCGFFLWAGDSGQSNSSNGNGNGYSAPAQNTADTRQDATVAEMTRISEAISKIDSRLEAIESKTDDACVRLCKIEQYLFSLRSKGF